MAKPSKKLGKKKAAAVEEVKSSKKKKGSKVEKVSKKAKGKKAKTTRAKKEVVYTPVKEKLSRTSLIEHLVETSAIEVDKKQVKAIVEALANTITGSVVKKGIGEFTFPGLFKVITKHVPAKKGGEKKKNPFTGEMMITKAKPATVKVKIRPMKALKDASIAHLA